MECSGYAQTPCMFRLIGLILEQNATIPKNINFLLLFSQQSVGEAGAVARSNMFNLDIYDGFFMMAPIS